MCAAHSKNSFTPMPSWIDWQRIFRLLAFRIRTDLVHPGRAVPRRQRRRRPNELRFERRCRCVSKSAIIALRSTSGGGYPQLGKSIVMTPGPDDAVPDTAAVRDALARVGASDELRTSPQLVAFLTFVVDAVLSGRSDRIKAYAIGVEALGRGAGFDPQ